MSDEGKSWFKVKDSGGLRVFVFERTETEALEVGGRVLLIAEPADEEEAITWFQSLSGKRPDEET